MKTVAQIVSELYEQNIRLWAEDGQLRYKAPRGALTPALRDRIVQRRDEILAFLSQAQHSVSTPAVVAKSEPRFPLSYGQQALWFLYLDAPESAAYNMLAPLLVQSELDVPALRRALQVLVDRHPALRTTFSTDNGYPVQDIRNDHEIALEIVDAGDWDWDEVRHQVKSHSERPFNLESGPIFRASLFTVAARKYVLLLTLHHIAGDASSFAIMLDELLMLYEAETAGQTLELPTLPATYADYVRWERDLLAGAEGERLAAYWQQQLAGEIPVLNLPTDRPRLPVQSYQGATYPFTVSPELTQQLKALARAEQTTLFATLLAIFQLLLHRYTGQEEIWVGSPMNAGRSRSEFANIVGYLVNPVVLRARFSRTSPCSFKHFLDEVRQNVLAALEHQFYPFPLLVKQLQPVRDSSHTPVFQVVFGFEGSHLGFKRVDGSDFSVELLEMGQMEGQFDLSLIIGDGDALTCKLKYDTDIFEPSTIARMVGHFLRLMTAVVDDPTQPINELPLLTKAERQQLLFEWNDTQTAYPHDQAIPQLFEAQAERDPNALAVVFGEQQLTYRELNTCANQLAHHLQARGVGPEAIVAICMQRSPEMVVGLLAILKAGGAYLPLDPDYPPERLAFMLEDATVSVLLTQERLRSRFPETAAQLVCLDTHWSRIASHSSDNLTPQPQPNHLAYVIYTSGSTGKPKGVRVPHRAICRLVCNTNYIELSPKDRMAQASNASFDAATFELWGALLHGATLVGIPREVTLEPQEFADYLQRHKISVVLLTTALFNQIVRAVPQAFQSLRHLLFGGEAVEPSTVRAVLEHGPPERLLHVYGPTESTTFATWYLVEAVPEDASTVPIGSPVSNTQLYVLDAQLEPVPVGVPGELYIGGDGLAHGYHHQAELTQAKFIANPFGGGCLYRTGDVVRYLPGRAIEFLGRVDDQVKLRGFRIELGEIEVVLSQHPSVQASVVVVREEPVGQKHLVAYVVPGDLVKASAFVPELRHHLRQTLPEYMAPSAFVLLDSLPLTPNGKVDRRALPAPERSGLHRADNFVLPRTPTEEKLAAIWRDVLGLEQVGIHDNFFEIGGDSILSIQIVARAKQAGYRIAPNQLFQKGTIAELAAVAGEISTAQAQQGIVTGSSPLTPIQHWFFERNLDTQHHFNQSVLLDVRPHVKTECLSRALQQMLRHHDALRLRFTHDASSIWQQHYAAPADDVPFSVIDLSQHAPAERQLALAAQAEKLQASLSLSDGPLMRMALFDFGPDQPGRLLWVIHHLAVDGVSWRILLDDLTTVYQQLERGEAVRLPDKTTSYQDWANWLAAYAQSETLSRELDGWLAQQHAEVTPLPVDFPAGRAHNTVASAADVSCSLSAEETQALLREAPAAYHTQVNDLLLTALMQAFAPWTGSDSLFIDLEGHGREALSEDIDLSRTVGWFTAIFPIRLQLDRTSLGNAIKSIKEQLRRIPNRGIGYGILRYLKPEPRLGHMLQAEIAFNYFGQFSRELGAQAPQTQTGPLILGTAQESSGPAHSTAQTRSHLIEINGMVVGNQLQMDWTYSQNIHIQTTLERLANRFIDALRALIAHCQLPEAGGDTPGDFPNAQLDQTQQPALLQTSSLVPIQPHGTKLPFFCVPGSSGSVVYLSELSHYLGSDQPFYGLQPVGLDGETEPLRSIEAMAAHYIEALQSVQPQGPYVLGGHSFGAFVAFEMSQQLVKGGHEVARLVIFDTPFQKPLIKDHDLEQSTVLLEVAQQYAAYSDKTLEVSHEKLQSLEPDEQLEYLTACLKAVKLFPSGADAKVLRGMVQVIQTSGRILYTPQNIVAVPVILFRARDEQTLWADIPDAALGWGDIMGEALEQHVVPGDHNTMLLEPQVQTLAERLLACLAHNAPQSSQATGHRHRDS